jgi:hypothetical protein
VISDFPARPAAKSHFKTHLIAKGVHKTYTSQKKSLTGEYITMVPE